MEMIICAERRIVFNNVVHIWEIKTSRSNIGTNQNTRFGGLSEGFERCCPDILGKRTVEFVKDDKVCFA